MNTLQSSLIILGRTSSGTTVKGRRSVRTLGWRIRPPRAGPGTKSGFKGPSASSSTNHPLCGRDSRVRVGTSSQTPGPLRFNLPCPCDLRSVLHRLPALLVILPLFIPSTCHRHGPTCSRLHHRTPPHFLPWHQLSTTPPGLALQGSPVLLPSKVSCGSLYAVPVPREVYLGPPCVTSR